MDIRGLVWIDIIPYSSLEIISILISSLLLMLFWDTIYKEYIPFINSFILFCSFNGEMYVIDVRISWKFRTLFDMSCFSDGFISEVQQLQYFNHNSIGWSYVVNILGNYYIAQIVFLLLFSIVQVYCLRKNPFISMLIFSCPMVSLLSVFPINDSLVFLGLCLIFSSRRYLLGIYVAAVLTVIKTTAFPFVFIIITLAIIKYKLHGLLHSILGIILLFSLWKMLLLVAPYHTKKVLSFFVCMASNKMTTFDITTSSKPIVNMHTMTFPVFVKRIMESCKKFSYSRYSFPFFYSGVILYSSPLWFGLFYGLLFLLGNVKYILPFLPLMFLDKNGRSCFC